MYDLSSSLHFPLLMEKYYAIVKTFLIAIIFDFD